MAVMGFIFAAKKAASIKLLRIDIFNISFCHKIKKIFLVNFPCATIFLVFI